MVYMLVELNLLQLRSNVQCEQQENCGTKSDIASYPIPHSQLFNVEKTGEPGDERAYKICNDPVVTFPN